LLKFFENIVVLRNNCGKIKKAKLRSRKQGFVILPKHKGVNRESGGPLRVR
jgi:hypothetical protein